MKKILCLALFLPAVSLANGYDVPNVNPRDLAMAGSGVAAQQDAAAAFANPASLSKLHGLNLSLALSGLFLGTDWSGSGPLAGHSASTHSPPSTPFALFAAYGFELGGRNAGVGIGANVIGGGNVFWDDNWDGRGSVITVDQKVLGAFLTGGYEVLPRLRLGAGLVYYYTAEYLKVGIQPSNDAFAEVSDRGGAFSFDLSAEYTLPSIPLSFGADFKYKAKMQLKGNGKFVVPGGLLPSDPPPVDQGITHELTYPSVLNLGLGYRVGQPLLLTFGWTWTGYSVYQSDTFVGDKGTTITVPRNYKDGYTYRLGAEYDLNPKLQLRAGVLRDLSGLDSNVYSASLPDANSWAASLGGAWRVRPNLSLEASFFYAWLERVTVTGAETFPGSYKTNVWIATAGVTWQTDLGGGR
jgi:long-chain fatty acid transport protein